MALFLRLRTDKKLAAKAIFALLSILTFSPLFFHKGIFNVDNYLIESLKELSGLGDYFRGLAIAKVHDIQPLRDVSYVWDLMWQSFLGAPTFIVTNTLIWIVTGWVLIDIFGSFKSFTSNFWLFVMLAFLTHPVFCQSVILIAARKHLLAFLFISLFLREVFRESPNNIKLSLFFLGSLLSHPLNIGLSLWYVCDLKVRQKEENGAIIKRVIPLLAVSLVIGLINMWWYFGVYEKVLGITRHEGGFSLADSLLAYGRYLSFALFPDFFATFYGKQSLFNMIGLLAFPVVFWVFAKTIGKEKTVSFGLLFFLSLLPVTYKTFWFFVSHTYFLVGLMSLLLMLWLMLSKMEEETVKKWFWVPLVFVVVFTGLNMKSAVAYKDPSGVIKDSYHADNNCINLHYYVGDLFDHHQNDLAAKLGEELVERKCIWLNKNNRINSEVLYSKILAYSKDDKTQKREEILERLGNKALYFKFAWAVFYLKNAQEGRAFDLLAEVMDHNRTLNPDDTFVRTFLDYCKTNTNEDLDSYCENLEFRTK